MKNLVSIFMLGVTLQAAAGCKYFAVAECASRLKVPTAVVAALLHNLECVMQSEQTRDAYCDIVRIQRECGLTDAYKKKSILYPLSHKTQKQVTLTTDSLLTALYQHTKALPPVEGLGVWTFNVRGPVGDSLTADFPTIEVLLADNDINRIRCYPEYFLGDMQQIMHERIQ
jgi:hypothetical protein